MLASLIALAHLYVPIGGALALSYLCLGQAARKEYWLRLATIAVVLTGIAFLLPSLIALHIIMFLVVPLTARRNVPGDAAAIYLFTMLLLPALETDLYLGGTRLWLQDIDQTLGLGTLATLLRHRAPARVNIAWHAPFLCIFTLAVIASARDTSFTHLLRALLETFLVYGLPYVIFLRSIRTQEDIRRCMIALAIGGAVTSAVLITEAFLGWPFYRELYPQYGLGSSPVLIHMRAGLIRAAGPFVEPISGAVVLCFCFYAAWLSGDRFKSRAHHMAFTALIVFGLTAPQSRSAWIGALIGVLIIDLYRKRFGPLWRNIAILALAAAAVLPFAFANHDVAEVVGLGQEARGSADYRVQLWERGKQEVAKHPLTGQPRDKVVENLQDLRTGENIVDFVNTYLYWALVLGIPGALIFIAALLGGVLAPWRLAVRDRGPAAAFIVAGLTAQIVMLSFTFFWGRPALLIVGLMAMAAVFPKRVHEKARRPVPRKPGAAGAPPAPLIVRTELSPVER